MIIEQHQLLIELSFNVHFAPFFIMVFTFTFPRQSQRKIQTQIQIGGGDDVSFCALSLLLKLIQ
jgi:hypothetical protein